MSRWLWSVLYRYIHLLTYTWNARGQTSRDALRAIDRRQPLPAFWQTRTPGCLLAISTGGRGLWSFQARSHDSAHPA
jgi:hypothetical protein